MEFVVICVFAVFAPSGVPVLPVGLAAAGGRSAGGGAGAVAAGGWRPARRGPGRAVARPLAPLQTSVLHWGREAGQPVSLLVESHW